MYTMHSHVVRSYQQHMHEARVSPAKVLVQNLVLPCLPYRIMPHMHEGWGFVARGLVGPVAALRRSECCGTSSEKDESGNDTHPHNRAVQMICRIHDSRITSEPEEIIHTFTM